MDKPETFLKASQVQTRYGVSHMALHKWLKDPSLGFPKPLIIRGLRFWKVSDLEAFETRNIAKAA